MKGLNGTVSTIQTIFIVLKLVGAISWSWWWVLSPLWIPLVVLAIFLFVIYLLDKDNEIK
ncbi:MAG TPA: hypothetical protein GX708_03570 [Gallicola sp.]|jgi:hypothetical protein|nr:hypothetical protein [Gallicola sp.]